MITVRAMTKDDLATWRALRLDGIRRYPNAFLAEESEAQSIPEDVDLRQLFSGMRFGAFDGNICVGIAGLNRASIARARHRAEVGPFYVIPQAQGTGAAQALIQAIKDHAQSLNIWQLDLTVAETNQKAIAFYERAGFVRMGRIPNAIIGADGPEDDAFYVLELPQQP